jgi:glycosyltransferase involved in cell wall biosynthesis
MNVYFFEPPPAQKAGGLEAAIQSLAISLQNANCRVEINAAVDFSRVGRDTLVHFHGIWQPSHPQIARQCREHKVPYLISPHGMLEPWAWKHKWWKKWPYFHTVEKKYLLSADAILATGQEEAGNIGRLLRHQNIAVLPLGLTGDARPGYDAARRELGWNHEWILLYLSRIHPKKGLNLLLEALAALQGQLAVPMRLVVVGGGEESYVRSLQEWSRHKQQALPRVDWVGEVWGDARWKYFQGADLFCLPTHSENFGLAVLEACQVGTPVLTTRATPWSRLLEERGGYICEPNVNAIQQSVLQFLKDGKWHDTRRLTLSEWAWQAFNWDTLVQDYLKLYQKLLRG